MESLEQQIEQTTEQVVACLKPVSEIDGNQARTILRRYVAAIEPNFLAWMSAAAISARSPYGKYAAEENLWVEIRDNHPGMLRNFAKECTAEPDANDFQAVQTEVNSIRQITAELSGLRNLVLMMLLENTSSAFVPYLAEIGKKLGAKDFTYTDVHGEADIEHANQFLRAVNDEMSL